MSAKNETIAEKLFLIHIIFLVYITMILILEVPLIDALIISISYLGLYYLLTPIIDRKSNAIKPLTLLPIMFVMYALGPLLYQNLYDSKVIVNYLFINLLGLVFLILGLKSVRMKDSNDIGVKADKLDIQALKLVVYIFLLISMLSVASEVLAFGGLKQMLAAGYGLDRINILKDSVVIGGGFQWLILSGIVTWYYGYKTKGKLFQVVGVLVSVFSLFVLLIIGARSTIIYSVIFLLVLYSYDVKKVKIVPLVVVFSFGIGLAQLYSNARYYFPEGLESTINNSIRMVTVDPGAYLPIPKNISEFISPVRSLLDVLTNSPDVRFYGQSYVNAIGAPIPYLARFFVKYGVEINDWFLSTQHPDVFASGAGLGFSPVTEGYLNFGYIGVALHMFIYGWAASKVYAAYVKHQNILTLFLLAGTLPIFFLDALRIHLTSSLYKISRIYLVPMFLYWIVRYVLPKIVNYRRKS